MGSPSDRSSLIADHPLCELMVDGRRPCVGDRGRNQPPARSYEIFSIIIIPVVKEAKPSLRTGVVLNETFAGWIGDYFIAYRQLNSELTGCMRESRDTLLLP